MARKQVRRQNRKRAKSTTAPRRTAGWTVADLPPAARPTGEEIEAGCQLVVEATHQVMLDAQRQWPPPAVDLEPYLRTVEAAKQVRLEDTKAEIRARVRAETEAADTVIEGQPQLRRWDDLSAEERIKTKNANLKKHDKDNLSSKARARLIGEEQHVAVDPSVIRRWPEWPELKPKPKAPRQDSLQT